MTYESLQSRPIDAKAGVVETRRDLLTGEALGVVAVGGAAEAARAVDRAHTAFMRGLPADVRSQILSRAASLLEESADELATLIRREVGKPATAAATEVARAVTTTRYAAEEARRLPGERVPLEATAAGAGVLAVTVPEPRGVVAAITPFNFPVNLVMHKVAPALAAGCPVVLKPSEKAPLTSLRIAELLAEAGLPEGWLEVVHGHPEPIVDAWCDDDRVAVLTFTGSAKVGWSLKARSPRKIHILELGSTSAMYVSRDADLDLARRDAVQAGFAYAGQACISLQRLYVDDVIADEFLALLAPDVSGVRAGDPAAPEVVVGPLITDAAAERVSTWIGEARDRGATILAGGDREGPLVSPTLVLGAQADDKLMCEEVFGPVISAARVSGVDEAIERINDSRFGLNTSIYTRDLAASLRFAEQVRSGTVLVNMPPSFRADHMPYGGIGDSGQGREGVRYTIAEMVDMKLVLLNPGGAWEEKQ
ncbi:aldehyde dehydrogenase family protein [Occultella gossypii]|uniref:Aldehyde dehydrogenase family protein n=1 Tax=Occultella gossypii TaxID=2800820 RepID=A0ABS7SC88_9MICO|nr:aldehyde dehydrogenase family protein [Occultella gossypii]MBZ2197970.1 aldehyde dehydrogenase family protein [Occultella gossypii]